MPFSARAAEEIRKHITGEENIPISAFIMPKEMDFRRAGYSIIDGLYYAYLLIPSDGYKPHVAASWLSLLVNAGEGIDVDIFLNKEPKEKVRAKGEGTIPIRQTNPYQSLQDEGNIGHKYGFRRYGFRSTFRILPKGWAGE